MPTQYCQGQEDRITIDGNGFTDEHVDESRAQCRFTTATGEIYCKLLADLVKGKRVPIMNILKYEPNIIIYHRQYKPSQPAAFLHM